MLSQFFSFFKNLYQGKKRESKVLMLGLEYSGKTALLYRLHLGKFVETNPTIGFNVESIIFQNLQMHVYDVNGQFRRFNNWRHWFPDVETIVFVVDSTDIERFDEVRDQIKIICKFIQDGIEISRNTNILIFSNKQDSENAVSTAQLIDALALSSISSTIKWNVQNCSATTGEGINEGFEWIYNNIPLK